MTEYTASYFVFMGPDRAGEGGPSLENSTPSYKREVSFQALSVLPGSSFIKMDYWYFTKTSINVPTKRTGDTKALS